MTTSPRVAALALLSGTLAITPAALALGPAAAAAAGIAPARDAEAAGRPVVIPGDHVIAVRRPAGALADLAAVLADLGLAAPDAAGPDTPDARLLMQWTRRGDTRPTAIVQVRGLDAAAAAALARRPDVAWVEPNRAILEDPRELVPSDPQYPDQYHHPLMGNDAAWDITLGDPGVAIAITDDGVDLDHEDLAANIWVNSGEIPGNGLDDDANGYVDDVLGWDVLFDDNDPNPNSGSDDHGTHVAGIAAGRTDNGVGIAGTAGHATIMAIQFYAGGQPWTAADIAEAFAYATDNGARIVNTSYNINGWVGNPVVTAAFDYMYDNGVLHFNSAGNGNQLNPPRQAFHQTILVANTNAADQRSSSSNYGTGVDVSAPGSSIRSTVPDDGYANFSGTSMAAPNAAGVAALVWSLHPDWSRDQVVAQVLGTADDIDAVNPGFEGLLGTGRVNALRALTETLPAPRLESADGLPEEGGTLSGDLGVMVLRFDAVLDPATVNGGGAFGLRAAGPDGVFGTGDDTLVPVPADEYLVGANEIRLQPDLSSLPAGLARFEIDGGTLADPFGTAFDGDGDGQPGGDFTVSFVFCPGTVVLEDTLESGAGWTVENTAVTDGAWDAQPSVPLGGGDRGDPANDFDGSGRCFLTDNVDGNSDVDGGPTRLISPPIDVAGVDDPWITYARWFTSDDDDTFTVHASNDGGASWRLAELVQSAPGWSVGGFRVLDVFPGGADSVRVRFTAVDNPNDSVVEAAIDRLRVMSFDCESGPGPGDPADVDGDGIVGITDLLAILAAWGPCNACPADVDGDGTVGITDLLAVLAAWD